MNIINLPKIIVIIDDNMFDILILERLIKLCNLQTEVVSFEDIYQAIQYFSNLQPSFQKGVILLDLYIKPHWAWDFLEEYKKKSPHSVHSVFDVYVMSSSPYYEREHKVKIGQGVKGYLKKPLNKHEIEQILA